MMCLIYERSLFSTRKEANKRARTVLYHHQFIYFSTKSCGKQSYKFQPHEQQWTSTIEWTIDCCRLVSNVVVAFA